MNTIELQQTLPAVFAGRNSIISDVWHQSLTLKRGEAYLVEAASGTGNHRFAATYTDTVTTIKVSSVLTGKISVRFRCATGWRFGNVPSVCCFRNYVCLQN